MLTPSFPSPGSITQTITINTTAIPQATQDRLAEATLALVHSILSRPDGRNQLDARIAQKAESLHTRK